VIAGFLVRIGAGRFEVFRVLMWSRCGRRLDLNNEMSAIPVVPEYGFMNRVNAFRGSSTPTEPSTPNCRASIFATTWQDSGLFYLVPGEHETRSRAVLAEEGFDMLEALVVLPSHHKYVYLNLVMPFLPVS
jgi:hypothetical protein